jgi:hypothetical protein
MIIGFDSRPQANERRIDMTRLIITTFATVALIAAASIALRSHSSLAVHAAGMPSLQELQSAAGVNKLPIEQFEDMSLVYSTTTEP